MAKKRRPTKLIPLVIYLIKMLLSKKLGPLWLRALAMVLLGLLMAFQLLCNGG